MNNVSQNYTQTDYGNRPNFESYKENNIAKSNKILIQSKYNLIERSLVEYRKNIVLLI